jgi:wyosine [tRNA(Phe)-imidazoG37] synthetase (radical SAM superfamily)
MKPYRVERKVLNRELTMGESEGMISYGPVPSRRLGRSLGINNIVPKECTYSCVYCQVGRTSKKPVERRPYYKPDEIFESVSKRVGNAADAGESIDYLTFVPNGEPTLDINLGREIERLRCLGIKIAVITNASLIWREDVREDLSKADWVSLKMDSANQRFWRKLDRPHQSLNLSTIMDGMLTFREQYEGELVTETMLINGFHDDDDQLKEIVGFLAGLKPDRAYLSIPTRPPAEKWVKPPDEKVLNEAFQIFNAKIFQVEYLIGYEGNAFAFTGNVEEDLLSITAVHPMRKDAVNDYLIKAGADWSRVEKLIAQRRLIETEYDGKKFYLRNL